MALISMTKRHSRVLALRPDDRVEREPLELQSGPIGLLAGTAIVAGCVVGLFLYDAGRPFATGAIQEKASPPLVISVEPMQPSEAQPR